MTEPVGSVERLRRFSRLPWPDKLTRLYSRFRGISARLPAIIKLEFGGWFFVGDSAVDAALASHRFEKPEILFAGRYIRPEMTVLDIGAHHGLYSILASKCVGPRGRVIAFEPSPRERKQLKRNLLLNFSSNVQVEACALGRERSEADLYLVEGGDDGCNSLRPPDVTSSTHCVKVQITSLDDFAIAVKLHRVDFVKLDVEGAELDVLNGARRLLMTAPRPVLLVEVYDIRTKPWGYAANQIVQFLDGLAYKWFSLESSGSIIPIAHDLGNYDANLVAIPAERESEVLRSLGAKASVDV